MRLDFQGLLHGIGIHAASVALDLIEVLGVDTDYGELLLDIQLVAAGVVVRSAGGVGNQRDRLSEVGLEKLRLGHVLGDLAEDIVVIP